jgi:hypothetical protein
VTSHRRQLGLFLALGLVLLPFLFLLLRPETGSESIPDGTQQLDPRAPVQAVPLERTEALAERREEARDVGVERAHDRGIVRSTSGRSVQGARVVLHALVEEDTETPCAWDGLGVPVREVVETTTGADGRFRFGQLPAELPFGAALVAFHPAHQPAGLDLPGDLEQWPAELVVTLEPAAPFSVEVVDAAGKPQGEVTVHHVGKPRKPTVDAPLRVHERFFAEKALTDAAGRAELPPFPGEQSLWAEKGSLTSVPWHGVRPSAVVLTLGESFTVGGTLSISNQEGWSSDEGGEQRILVSGLTGNLWRPLACLPAVQQGEWGPLRVPLGGIARYKVRVEGAPVLAEEESFDRPRAGSHRRIDFVVERGVEAFLVVTDESANPIPTAFAEAWWEPTLNPKVSLTAVARPDGVIRLAALPPGTFSFRLAAPGFSAQDLGAEAVDKIRIPVTLLEGGGITGRCVHEGSPVSDFQVIFWKSGTVSFNRSASFLGREDGRFEIEGLAPADWAVLAASPEFPSGKPLVVTVNAERNTEVELELPTAIRGGGRILDAESGEPVPNAHVQAHSTSGSGLGLPWGPGVLSESDGSFDLDAFVLGVNHITIEAEGFAFADIEANATDTEFLDWGDIRLFRPQALQVTLHGLENLQGVDPSGFHARTETGHLLPDRSFDEQGVVRYEAVPAGGHRLVVLYPDGSWGRLQLELEPGKEWNFDLRVAGDRKLDIHVVDALGKVPPHVTGVYWTAQEETGLFVVRFGYTEDGRAHIEGIQAAQGQLWVLAADDTIAATKDVAFGSETMKSVEIRLGEAQFRVHVVDARREPIPGAWVTIRSASGEIHGADQTGPDGWAELGGLPAATLLMDVQHGTLGRSFGVHVDASAKEHEFVLAASGSMELELLDGDEPLVGVLTRIQTKAGLTLDDARQTDDQGKVRYELLGEGNYHLACHRADCWPTTVDEELAPGGQARVRVQMRRLADLELTLRSADGLAVSGATIEVVSQEFGLPVATWIQDERVRAPAGLTTDTQGALRVEGLPRGAYDWSVTVGSEELGGSFELLPARTNRVPVFLERHR